MNLTIKRMNQSGSFRPIIDPLQGLLDEKIIFTTSVIEPIISPEKRAEYKKKSGNLVYIPALLVLAFVFGLLRLEFLALTFFSIFSALLLVYVIILGPLFSKKVEAHTKNGTLQWNKDHFVLQQHDGVQRKIAYQEVLSIQRKEGIPHELFSKSRHSQKEMISIIFTMTITNDDKIELELFYKSIPICSDPLQTPKWNPLTEQLFQFVFKNYSILDKRALEHGYSP